MTFAQPYLLFLLLAVPLLAWLRGRHGDRAAFLYSSVGLVKSIGGKTRSRAGGFLATLRWLALALLIVALARPQIGEGEASVKASGIDIVVAADLSTSMLAEDFELKGQPVNRFIIVKDVLEKFIQKRPSDRIGLVAFGSQAFVASPLTLDHDFLLTNLQRLNIGTIDGGSTAIGSGLTAALNRLRDIQSKSKIVILMTDGVNNAGKIPPITAAEVAQTLGIKVYTIGVGSRGLAKVPYVDVFGRHRYRETEVDIDEATLQKIADRTGGKYYRADDSEKLRQIYAEIDQLEKTEIEVKKYQHYREMFAWFAGPALALVLAELALANTLMRRLP